MRGSDGAARRAALLSLIVVRGRSGRDDRSCAEVARGNPELEVAAAAESLLSSIVHGPQAPLLRARSLTHVKSLNCVDVSTRCKVRANGDRERCARTRRGVERVGRARGKGRQRRNRDGRHLVVHRPIRARSQRARRTAHVDADVERATEGILDPLQSSLFWALTLPGVRVVTVDLVRMSSQATAEGEQAPRRRLVGRALREPGRGW